MQPFFSCVYYPFFSKQFLSWSKRCNLTRSYVYFKTVRKSQSESRKEPKYQLLRIQRKNNYDYG